MKKVYFLLVAVVSISFSSLAQNNAGAKQAAANDDLETNCYLKWAARFEERGASDVEDGTHEDIIVTFRNGSNADCLKGKVDVKDGKVTAIYLRLEDGSYEQVKRKWKYEIKDVTIGNGMSKTLITSDDELINVLFIKKIKPKKKGYEKAPVPSDY